MQIIDSTFESILPIWQNQLWPGRFGIASFSWMKLGGGHYGFFEPQKKFWQIEWDDKVVGVLSAHALPENAFIRTRGLWVDEAYRRKKVASHLLLEATNWARAQGAEILWTYPRQEAWSVYEKCGFLQVGPWLQDEKGQINCYASKRV